MNDTLVMVKIIIKNILDILLFRKPNGFFGAWVGVYLWILIITEVVFRSISLYLQYFSKIN